MDKYKVCSLHNKAPPNFGSSAAFSCQFCQALRCQNRSKGLVCHYSVVSIKRTGCNTRTGWSKKFFLVHEKKEQGGANFFLEHDKKSTGWEKTPK